MNLVNQLLNDEAGFVVSSELVLIGTILVIGMITGLTTLRDGVIQELVDLSRAIGSVQQTYQYNTVTAHTSSTNGSTFTDKNDYCEAAGPDTGNLEPGCLILRGLAANNEAAPAAAPSNAP